MAVEFAILTAMNLNRKLAIGNELSGFSVRSPFHEISILHLGPCLRGLSWSETEMKFVMERLGDSIISDSFSSLDTDQSIKLCITK